MYLGASVLVPRGFDEDASARYPAIYVFGHGDTPFGFDPDPASHQADLASARDANVETGHEFFQAWTSDDFPRVVAVTLEHPSPYFVESYAVNSANNGPYELEDLPAFRRFASIAAFSEGWGLYAERLPREMGLYQDPYDDFGRLSLALMRAARLVVDTGIHALRWTRDEEVAWMDANTPASTYDNRREVDRYIVLPGQAVSYYVGMLRILDLRARARVRLGARFDLATFHDRVLGQGPLPLPFLDEHIDHWIETEAAR